MFSHTDTVFRTDKAMANPEFFPASRARIYQKGKKGEFPLMIEGIGRVQNGRGCGEAV